MTGPARRGAPLPAGYGELLEQVKTEVRTARLRAARAANTELIALYWRVGRLVLDRQAAAGWGTRVIERLAQDLRAEFPQVRGLSRRNLFYMRSLAGAWPQDTIVQQPVAQLPWGHVTVLLDRLDDRADRDWYAATATQHGWSRDVLAHQITARLHGGPGRHRRTSTTSCPPATATSPNSSPATPTSSTSST